jgi:predicted AlkP superfamily phosphohydrolase/phosphomutase
MKQKLAIIGIDGASFNIISKFIDKLPTLQSFLKEGYYKNLESITPPLTYGAWTSIITGQNPGKHGYLDINKIGNDYQVIPHYSDKGFRLFDLFDRPILINYPASFPRQPKKGGLIIHSWLAPSKEKAFPEKVKSYNEYHDYIFEIPKSTRITRNLYFKKIVDEYCSIEKSRMQLAKKLLEKYEQDIFFIVFNTNDWCLHKISGSINYNKFNQLFRIWILLDKFLKWFLTKFDNIIILSDHGFEQKNKIFNINNYLNKKGWLNYKNNIFGGIKDIKFDKTVAFAYNGYGGIYINNQKYSKSTILNKETKMVSAMIKNDLIEANNKYKFFKNVFLKNEIYKGNKMNNLPEIIIDWEKGVHGNTKSKKGIFINNNNINEHYINKKIFPIYSHRKDGLIIAKGKDVGNYKDNIKPKLYDIVPTILDLYNIKIPHEIDGKKLSIFN